MEENVQVIAKKVWHILKVSYFMIRKNIHKKKLLFELKYLTINRHKLTHHRDNHSSYVDAYEFSCNNTPNRHTFLFPFCKHGNERARHQDKRDESHVPAMNTILDMMVTKKDEVEGSPCTFMYSPVLPGFGFGLSPVVRELRVTDSPYCDPCHQSCVEGIEEVDEAAEEFITRFYAQLLQQRITCA